MGPIGQCLQQTLQEYSTWVWQLSASSAVCVLLLTAVCWQADSVVMEGKTVVKESRAERKRQRKEAKLRKLEMIAAGTCLMWELTANPTASSHPVSHDNPGSPTYDSNSDSRSEGAKAASPTAPHLLSATHKRPRSPAQAAWAPSPVASSAQQAEPALVEQQAPARRQTPIVFPQPAAQKGFPTPTEAFRSVSLAGPALQPFKSRPMRSSQRSSAKPAAHRSAAQRQALPATAVGQGDVFHWASGMTAGRAQQSAPSHCPESPLADAIRTHMGLITTMPEEQSLQNVSATAAQATTAAAVPRRGLAPIPSATAALLDLPVAPFSSEVFEAALARAVQAAMPAGAFAAMAAQQAQEQIATASTVPVLDLSAAPVSLPLAISMAAAGSVEPSTSGPGQMPASSLPLCAPFPVGLGTDQLAAAVQQQPAPVASTAAVTKPFVDSSIGQNVLAAIGDIVQDALAQATTSGYGQAQHSVQALQQQLAAQQNQLRTVQDALIARETACQDLKLQLRQAKQQNQCLEQQKNAALALAQQVAASAVAALPSAAEQTAEAAPAVRSSIMDKVGSANTPVIPVGRRVKQEPDPNYHHAQPTPYLSSSSSAAAMLPLTRCRTGHGSRLIHLMSFRMTRLCICTNQQQQHSMRSPAPAIQSRTDHLIKALQRRMGVAMCPYLATCHMLARCRRLADDLLVCHRLDMAHITP